MGSVVVAGVAILAGQIGSVEATAATRAPRITSQPRNLVVVAGARVRFAVKASGTPTLKVRWQLSADRGHTWEDIAGATSRNYSFISSVSQRGDEFRAVFQNAAGSAKTKPAQLTLTKPSNDGKTFSAKTQAIRSTTVVSTVSQRNFRPKGNSSPVITLQPGSITVTAGATAQFAASASGTPMPSVRWQVSSNNGQSWTGIAGATSSSHSLVASVSQNGDEFHAVFSNPAGSAMTDPATLKVNAPGTTMMTDPSPATTTTDPAPAATATTTTDPAPAAIASTTPPPSAASGIITASDSKANCIYLGDDSPPSAVAALEQSTGVTYNCVELFAGGDPEWSDWDNPWPTKIVSDGWDAWLAASPEHQLVLYLPLVPNSVSPTGTPTNTAWEANCASGAYDQYAVTLGENLVAAGAGNSVIRLGAEFNGNWENDFLGNPSDANYSTELANWAECFQNEVTAMRSVTGAHFLFDWSPNTCTTNIPLAEAYPGNAYVDIIGADFYDEDCQTLKTAAEEGWSELYTIDPSIQNSMAGLVAFAKAENKPLSIPEWGETATDDTVYMNGIIGIVENNDVAYQSYYDSDDAGIIPLGSTIPASTAAYEQAFG